MNIDTSEHELVRKLENVELKKSKSLIKGDTMYIMFNLNVITQFVIK